MSLSQRQKVEHQKSKGQKVKWRKVKMSFSQMQKVEKALGQKEIKSTTQIAKMGKK